MLRVVFDRSAFHGDRFDALNASSLPSLVSRGKAQVHHTPTFLEETLRTRSSRAPWKEHLKFALQLDDRFLFRELGDIWTQELVMGRGVDFSGTDGKGARSIRKASLSGETQPQESISNRDARASPEHDERRQCRQDLARHSQRTRSSEDQAHSVSRNIC